MALWRLAIPGTTPRWAVGTTERLTGLLAPGFRLADLLSGSGPSLRDLQSDLDEERPPTARRLAPTDMQPIWAAGVTFDRSRKARKEESNSGDFYDLVYEAERPELFLKALPGDVRGPGDRIGIRTDSTWDVPEPELAVVLNSRGKIAGYALANDVSSRSIEGENPLYLPQAKIYDGSCALGPCIVPPDEAPDLNDIEMVLTIRRNEQIFYQDSVRLAEMRRRPSDLADWLFRAQRFPQGVILLTGTSIVPEPDFTLEAEDLVTIAGAGLGALENHVERVGVLEQRV